MMVAQYTELLIRLMPKLCDVTDGNADAVSGFLPNAITVCVW